MREEGIRLKTVKMERSATVRPEEAMRQLQEIFKERGSKALQIARREVLKEKITSKEAREALTYFMTEYWRDLARPTLLSLACEAVGGDPELTTPVAVSMILISGGIDVHDDIIDRSKSKNRRSTVYGKFGKDIALLVGDALLFKGLTLLHENIPRKISSEKMTLIIDAIQKTFFELGDAEALELQLRRCIDVSPQEYLQIVQRKAADVEAHTRIGAILGDASEKEIQALSQFGRQLGMMIILRDDWIDLLDLQESRHRIMKECLPIPILYALKDPKIKPKLNSILQEARITLRTAKAIKELTLKARTTKQFTKLMHTLAKDAIAKLESLGPNTGELTLLIQASLSSLAESP